jgi:deoxycytidylate deaminase
MHFDCIIQNMLTKQFSNLVHKHFCAILKNKKIIQCFVNVYGMHAEERAINFIVYRKLENISLIVIRVNSNNELCFSKPCVNCILKIKNLKIKKVIYSFNNNFLVEEKKDDINSTHLSLFYRTL